MVHEWNSKKTREKILYGTSYGLHVCCGPWLVPKHAIGCAPVMDYYDIIIAHHWSTPLSLHGTSHGLPRRHWQTLLSDISTFNYRNHVKNISKRAKRNHEHDETSITTETTKTNSRIRRKLKWSASNGSPTLVHPWFFGNFQFQCLTTYFF